MNIKASTFLAFLTALVVISLIFRAYGGKGERAMAPSPQLQSGEPVQPSAVDLAPERSVEKSEVDWKAQLTPAQYQVMRGHGTERSGSSPLLSEHGRGVFVCAGCGASLFASDSKFESGTGWPSFAKPFIPNHIVIAEDRSLWMERDEVRCARCGSHLGHVFGDGPAPTGKRYCMNGVALKFEARP